MTSGLPDRRFREPTDVGLVVRCRVCFAADEPRPERVEESITGAYYVCPHCEGSSPIRRDDVDTLLGRTRETSESPPPTR